MRCSPSCVANSAQRGGAAGGRVWLSRIWARSVLIIPPWSEQLPALTGHHRHTVAECLDADKYDRGQEDEPRHRRLMTVAHVPRGCRDKRETDCEEQQPTQPTLQSSPVHRGLISQPPRRNASDVARVRIANTVTAVQKCVGGGVSPCRRSSCCPASSSFFRPRTSSAISRINSRCFGDRRALTARLYVARLPLRPPGFRWVRLLYPRHGPSLLPEIIRAYRDDIADKPFVTWCALADTGPATDRLNRVLDVCRLAASL